MNTHCSVPSISTRALPLGVYRVVPVLLIRRWGVLIVKLLVVLPPQGLVFALGAGAGRVGRVGDNVRDLVLGVLLILQRRVRQTLLVPVKTQSKAGQLGTVERRSKARRQRGDEPARPLRLLLLSNLLRIVDEPGLARPLWRPGLVGVVANVLDVAAQSSSSERSSCQPLNCEYG